MREPDPDSPLLAAAEPVLRQLADGLTEEPVGVILTSPDGVVLTRITSSRRLYRILDEVSLAPGYSYSEEFAGTNGIGTALETRRPALVTSAEHYVACLGRLACAGVPITHPIAGTLAGVLDLTGWVEDRGPLLATLARSATAQIEARLLAQAGAQQISLLNAYLKACRRSPGAVSSRSATTSCSSIYGFGWRWTRWIRPRWSSTPSTRSAAPPPSVVS